MCDELNNALLQLATQRYEQIIDVNLSARICRVIWSQNATDNPNKLFNVDELWMNKKLYPNDMKALRKLHNIEFVKHNIEKHGTLCFKFRRRNTRRQFEWMQIEVVKNTWYSEDNVDVLMFVKSIEDGYGKEYKAKKEAEHLAKTDSLTGFYNRLAFNAFCNLRKFNSVGVVYIDLNQLKLTNDSKGHEAGDEYIKECCSKMTEAFSNYRRYRIGGDEFVIIAQDESLCNFEESVKMFTKLVIHSHRMPDCSIGYRWTDNKDEPIDSLMRDAEKDMYDNKETDYLKFHVERRHA